MIGMIQNISSGIQMSKSESIGVQTNSKKTQSLLNYMGSNFLEKNSNI